MIRDIYSIEAPGTVILLLRNSYKNHYSQRVNGGQMVLALPVQFLFRVRLA